ncbi:hypothetical protein KEM56_005816 [Ascosphaera pollenicola]|nr:hypothetical protein KEM56_005816 [Ascosphaera pollenicola]
MNNYAALTYFNDLAQSCEKGRASHRRAGLENFYDRAMISPLITVVVHQGREFSIPEAFLVTCSPFFRDSLMNNTRLDGEYSINLDVPQDIFEVFQSWLISWDMEFDFSEYDLLTCIKLAIFAEKYKIELFYGELIHHMGTKKWFPKASDLYDLGRLTAYYPCRALLLSNLVQWYVGFRWDDEFVRDFDSDHRDLFKYCPEAEDLFRENPRIPDEFDEASSDSDG